MATAHKGACGAIAALVIVPTVFAQSMSDGAGGVGAGVSSYAIEDGAQFREDAFAQPISPFVGLRKLATDVSRTRKALQQAHLDLGQRAVRAAPAFFSWAEGITTFPESEVARLNERDCLLLATLDDHGRSTSACSKGAGATGSLDSRDPESRSPPLREAAVPALMSVDANSVADTSPEVEGGIGRLMLTLDRRQFNDERILGGKAAGRVMPALPQPPVLLLAMSHAVSVIPPLAVPAASRAVTPPAAADTLMAATGPGPDTLSAPGHPALQLAQASPAAAVPVAPSVAPKFEIRNFVVEGNTLLKRERIDSLLAPFTGKNKDFGDVQRALEVLQSAYQEDGYGGVEIRLPEQELDRGEVKFVAIEAKVGRITIEGNEHFTGSNIRRSVPALREGVTPNSRDIAQSVRLANENPAKQSTVLLKGAEQEGQIDATIRVADTNPGRYSISLDNTGNENTGRLRLGFAFQHANVLGRDHVLTAQYLTSPANIHDVNVYGIGYRIPLYALGDSIDLVAGYSDVDSGAVQDLFNVSGKGAVYALRYNLGLTKWGDVEHKLTFGLDYRAYQNNVVPVGGITNLVPDFTVHPFSTTYLASLKQKESELSVFLSFARNLQGMNDGTDDIFKKARFQVGRAGYRLFRFGGTYSRSILMDWQARVRLDAQYTRDPLVTGEQFAIGGADNVRGFNERYTSNDKGYRTNWEIYSPDWGKTLGLGEARLRILAFYDAGVTFRNQPLPGERDATSLDSAGFGIRFSHKSHFSARIDFSHVLHDGTQGLVLDGRRNLNIVHFSTAWVW